MASELHIRILGPLVVERGGIPLPAEAWRSRQERRLLAILLARRGRHTTAEQLVAWLWPDAEHAAATITLRSAISSLRRTLEPGEKARASSRYIVTRTGGYAWNEASDTWIDAAEFAALAEAAWRSPKSAEHMAGLERAVWLYRGDLLEDEPEEPWLMAAREQLRHQFVRAVETLAEHLLTSAAYAAATEALRHGLVVVPLCEPLMRLLMRAQYAAGDSAGALRSYEHYRQALDRELGALPAAQTQALHAAILRGENGTSHQPRADTQPPAVRPPAATHTRPAAPLLIGRRHELTTLRQQIGQLAHRRGATFALVGEAGIGKSRLALEALHGAAGAGAQTIVLRCAPLERELPFAPLGEPLRHLIRVAPDALLRQFPASSMAQVAELLPALRDRLPDLPPVAAAPPAERRNQFLGALTDLALLLARTAPLLVLCDDAHWADEATLALLGRLAQRAPRHALLIMLAYRSEELTDNAALHTLLRELGREMLLTPLVLGRFDEHETAQLIAELSNTSPVQAAQLAPQIVATTSGNPLFITITVQALFEQQSAGTSASLRELNTGVPLRELRGMPVITDLVHGRLARLPGTARDLAELIAVLGRAVSLDLVEQLVPEDALSAAQTLLERQLLVENADGRIGFAHDLVRSVVADTLPSPRRRLLHHRAAQALIALHAQAPERAAEIAHHLALAGRGMDNELLRYATTAGDHARRSLAFQAALGHYTTAGVVAERLGSAAPLEVVRNAYAGRLRTYESLLDWEGVAETAARYERWAAGRPEAPLVLVAAQRLVLLRALTGDIAGAVSLNSQQGAASPQPALLTDLLERTTHILQPARALAAYAEVIHAERDLNWAYPRFTTAVPPPGSPAEELPRLLGAEEAAPALFQLGWALLAQGLQRDAHPCLQQAYTLAVQTGQAPGAVVASLQLAHCASLTGDAGETERWLAISLQTAEQAPQAAWTSIWPRIHQGFLWLQNDEHAKAHARFMSMTNQLVGVASFESHRASVAVGLGLVALRRGEREEAQQRLATTLVAPHKLYGFVYCAALHGVARLAGMRGEYNYAAQILRHALGYSLQRRLLPEYTHTALEIGRFERDYGNPHHALPLLDHVAALTAREGLAPLTAAVQTLRRRIAG